MIGILEKFKSSAPPPKAKQTSAAAAPASESVPPKDKSAKSEKKQSKAPEKTNKSTAKGLATKGSKTQKKGESSAAEVSSGGPLKFVPNGKEGRMKEEEKLKTIKWNFAQPRLEHIEQLKEQLVPCLSSDLHLQMFHDDFKKHIAALAILTQVFVNVYSFCKLLPKGAMFVLKH